MKLNISLITPTHNEQKNIYMNPKIGHITNEQTTNTFVKNIMKRARDGRVSELAGQLSKACTPESMDEWLDPYQRDEFDSICNEATNFELIETINNDSTEVIHSIFFVIF